MLNSLHSKSFFKVGAPQANELFVRTTSVRQATTVLLCRSREAELAQVGMWAQGDQAQNPRAAWPKLRVRPSLATTCLSINEEDLLYCDLCFACNLFEILSSRIFNDATINFISFFFKYKKKYQSSLYSSFSCFVLCVSFWGSTFISSCCKFI